MGTDKAVLEVDGTTLVERAVIACRAGGAGPVAVVGHRRPGALPRRLDAELIPDQEPGQGPVGGILSALGWSPAPVAIVVACDLPFLSGDLLARLVTTLHGRPAADVAVAATSRGLEPLIGVWRTSTGPAVAATLRDGQRAVAAVLDRLTVTTLRVDDDLVATNVNGPADLTAARGAHGPPVTPD